MKIKMKRHNLKHSFSKLRDVRAWVHYALGTIPIYFVVRWLFNNNYFDFNNHVVSILLLFVVIMLIDRIVHGLLDYD